jgi:hypothetical protein
MVEIYNSTVEDSLVALEQASIQVFDSVFAGDTIVDDGARISINGVSVE